MDREMDRADRQTYRHIFPHFRCCSLFLDMVVERKVQWPLWWSFCNHSNTLIRWGEKSRMNTWRCYKPKELHMLPIYLTHHCWFQSLLFSAIFPSCLFLVIHQLESRTVFFSAEYHQTLGWAPMFTNMCCLKKRAAQNLMFYHYCH